MRKEQILINSVHADRHHRLGPYFAERAFHFTFPWWTIRCVVDGFFEVTYG